MYNCTGDGEIVIKAISYVRNNVEGINAEFENEIFIILFNSSLTEFAHQLFNIE